MKVLGEIIPFLKPFHLNDLKFTQKKWIVYLQRIILVDLSIKIIQVLILSVRLCNYHHHL